MPTLPSAILLVTVLLGLAFRGQAQIRDGGIDPKNLGKGVWIYSLMDATNKLGGHITSVTNVNSLMQYYKSAGLRYCIVKAGTSDQLFGDCSAGPQFTANLVNSAHTNGLLIFGFDRSYGSNIVGEISVDNYIFNQGADGLVLDAEMEWESGNPWITNGPAQAWQLLSTLRSNWPAKFIAHAPLAIIGVHATFPYKEFGYWCDAVMPQVYHFSTAGLKGSVSAALNWADVNWTAWQNNLASLPQTNFSGAPVNWTNAIKPILPVQDVYGQVIPGGIICESAAGLVYSNKDVTEFMDYAAADPNAATVGGYRGASFWRADTMDTNQWSNISAATSGSYSNLVNNVVLDNPNATLTGAWTNVRVFGATTTSPAYYGVTGSDTNCFGTNYLVKARGSGSAFVQFTPQIVIPGNYNVYQWHPYLTNASTGTPFQIFGAAGTNLVFANQQTNAGNWSWLGCFSFAAGNSNFIRILDTVSDLTNLAVADGVKLAYAAGTVILDNTNTAVSYTGAWSTGTTVAGHYGPNYQLASSAATVTATAKYQPNFLNAGLYDVFIWYPPSGSFSTNAPWTIARYGGNTNLAVNEQVNGGGWLQIATGLPFGAGTNGFVLLANNATSGAVVADAVKFAFAGPFLPLSLPAIWRQANGAVSLSVTSTPGYAVWIDRTTNLLDWLSVTNLLNTNGQTTFTDNFATTNNKAFYRARQ